METTSTETPAATAPAPAGPQYHACEQCEAPLEQSQRYCVVCGTRRKHASDPGARFMATATSRTRGSALGPAPRATTRRRRAGLGTALAIAVVPAAVAVGVLVGRAGNGADANLLAALRQQKAEVVNIGTGAGAALTTATASTTGRQSRASTNSNGTGRALSTTKYGTFHSVAGLTQPNQATLNRSAQIVRHVQSTINKSYVNSQNNLPNVIPVP
jgi:hypothetical protein